MNFFQSYSSFELIHVLIYKNLSRILLHFKLNYALAYIFICKHLKFALKSTLRLVVVQLLLGCKSVIY